MVNKSVLQSQIQKVAAQYGYKSKRSKNNADDESATDIDNWSELDGIETVEKQGMIYSNVGKSKAIELNSRQLKLLQGGERSKKAFRDASEALEKAELSKRRRRKKLE
jgi:hypothetical protein